MDQRLQEIIIAEEVGWLEGASRQSVFIERGWIRQWHRPGDFHLTSNLPRYTKSLDAMHEAEVAMRHKPWFWQPYAQNLRHVVERDRRNQRAFVTAVSDLLHATAAQKAEAFLKTINKWIES